MTAALLPIECPDSGPHAGIVTLWLKQEGRPVVVLDSDLLRAIDATMDEVQRRWSTSMRGLVLASDSRAFVAGANLREIMDLSDSALHDYLRFGQRVFGRFAKLGGDVDAVRTVAAIHGAAVGGGLELAMHCDALAGARPFSADPAKPAREYPVGLPEAGLCICPGWGGTNMLPARIDFETAVRLTATGKTMTFSEAAQAGLFEVVVSDPKDLLNAARGLIGKDTSTSGPVRPWAIHQPRGPEAGAERSARFAAYREILSRVRAERAWNGAAQAVFECVEAGLERGFEAAVELEQRHLVRLRGTAEGKAAIGAFFERSAGKG